jgi:hypothetical protein
MDWVGSVSALAKNPGDAAKTPGMGKRLKRLAGKIISRYK